MTATQLWGNMENTLVVQVQMQEQGENTNELLCVSVETGLSIIY